MTSSSHKLAGGNGTKSRCLSLAPTPAELFGSEDPKVQVWDSFIPLWGEVVKFGEASQFDEVTYQQMLDDLARRGLCVYMDNDHKTARLGWGTDEVKALAFYCAVQVNHAGQLFGLAKLAGHTCCEASPLDPAGHPEGMAGFRCRVTPYGRQELPNYQALSIQFDPRATDEKGHEVGQALVCVSATNGPHIPGAGPPAGQFSAARSATNMADDKSKTGGADDAAKMTAEMDALRTELGLPDGSSGESVIGAALAIVKAAKGVEPDGDEAMDDSEIDAAYDEADGDGSMKKFEADAIKKEDKGPEFARKFSRAFRRNVARAVSYRRGQVVLAKQLGCKAGPRSIAKALMAHAAGQTNAEQRLAVIERERAEEKAQQLSRQREADKVAADATEHEIKTLLNAAGPKNAPIFSGKVGARELSRSGGAGIISDARGQELYATALRLRATPDDVRTWLPTDANLVTFTANGSPGGNASAGSQSGGGADRMQGAEQAGAIKRFRDQYLKETGELLIYQRAASILQQQFAAGNVGNFDYAVAKSVADRQGAECFVKGAK